MARLTEDEFRATMRDSPRRVAPDDEPPLDFWAYFDALPGEEWQGHHFGAETVSCAYEMPGRRSQHVLLESSDKNVSLVLVLDLKRGEVRGHHLLDLNRRYGLNVR